MSRIPYLVRAAAGKTVLDLGAYDETALSKAGTSYWLHGQLAKSATLVVGTDNSIALPEGGVITGSNSRILKLDLDRLPDLTAQFRFDVVIAGELLEHLTDSLRFLTQLRAVPALAGKTLIITTPNATALHNCGLAVIGRESCHKDHLQVYSYKTLRTLFSRAGFSDYELVPYHVQFSELCLRTGRIQRHLVRLVELAIHQLERVFPLLSGGWIVTARI